MAIVRYSDGAAAAMLDGLEGYINTGAGDAVFKFYTGTIPTTGDTAIGSQTLLATVTCSDPVETGPAASRELVYDTITGANAVADGVATFAAHISADDEPVAYFDVGNLSSSAALRMSSTSFVTGQPINITSMKLRVPVTISV